MFDNEDDTDNSLSSTFATAFHARVTSRIYFETVIEFRYIRNVVKKADERIENDSEQ